MAPMLPGWRYAPIRITIPAGSVPEALEDFPSLVKLSGASGRSAENITRIFSILGGDENRKRILVTTESGDPCYVEIKEWSTATRTAYLWVRVPRIDPGQTTHLYLYFDPLHAEMTAYVGDTGEPAAHRVWSNGYADVWHMKAIPVTKKTLYAGEVSSSAIGGAAANAQVAFDPIDCTGLTKGNGWLKIDIKCDLPENLTGDSQLEITSAGGPDTQEWNLVNVHGTYGISTEWRTYYFPLSSARTSGSELDPARINFIRWYVWLADGAPATTISWRNAEIVSTADLPGGTNVSILLDSTRNQNHGTVYGATVTQGPLGTALAFDGVDDYVDCGNSVTLDPGANDFTLEVMAKAVSGTYGRAIVSKGGWGSTGFSIQQAYSPADKYYFVTRPSGSGYVSVYLGLSTAWDWKYIGGSRSGNTLSAVVDGIAKGNTVLPPDASLSSSRLLLIGKSTDSPANFFNGEVGFVALSSVARSPAWIAATNLSLRDELIVYSDPGDIVTFAATPHVGPAPLTVQFTDQSTGAPTSWLWDFGDGYSSTEQHPIHIYETPGIYTVTLTVRNEHGAYRGIREGYITVGRPPVTRYALSVYEVKTGRLPGWANEPIMLTIPAGSVTGVLEDFPVMVKLSGSSGANHADVSKVFVALGSDANRKRICVTAGDGITPCYVEIKEWNTATQTAYLWVRVPRIDPGLDTHLYLYYDPLHAEMTDYVGDTATETAWNVWDDGYGFVGIKPSGGLLLDSTRNQNHGTIYGATVTQGPLGTALAFDGVDDYTSALGAAPSDPSSGSASILFTRAWATNDNVTHGLMCIGGFISGTHQDYKRLQMFKWAGNNSWYFRLANETSMAQVNVLDSEIPANVLTYVTITWANGLVSVYVNGVLAGTFAQAAPSTWLTNHVELGRAYMDNVMHGQIMGAWVSSVARSPAWIAATNLSLRDELIVYSDPGAPLTLAAYVDAYEYLSWTRRYRRPGAWKCQINRYLPAAKEFVPGRLVHFRRNGEDRLGLIETRQISVDTSGRPSEVWTVAGREVLGILGDRLCLHGVSTGTGYDVQTGPAETVMRHYVDANAINPADLARIVPFLSLAQVDGGRGGTTKQSARFDVLTDLLESICAASGLGYRGRWSWDDRRLYFEVLRGVDRSASVKLSPALGNCTIKGYHESTNLAPSVAVVAGQGEAADRMVVDVGKEAGLCGLARRERFVDARDLTTEADLRQRGAEKLAEDGDTTTLEIEYIQTAMYRYGEDFDLGDIVHVEYPDIAAMDARIVEIVEEYAREGERLTLVLGTEWPDLTGVLRLVQKDNVVKRV